jgi:hypothetical protein
VDCAKKIDKAVADAFAKNNLGPAISLLQTMGTTLSPNATRSDVLTALRALGAKITADAGLRAQYCATAKSASFIQ